MQISGVKYYSNTQYEKNCKQAPSFNGYRTVFSKKLDEVILTNTFDDTVAENLTKLLNDFMKKHFNVSKRLGSGFHGSVYKIDDKYVLKKPNAGAYLFCFEGLPKQQFKALKTYYGEPVADFKHGKILKNVYSKGAHMQVGVPGNMLGHCLPEDCTKYYEQIYLPCFASVSQRAFDAIAKDFDTLNKMGKGVTNYSFDFNNPNNFVLAGSTLRITDAIAKVSTPNPNSMAEMLSTFLSKTNINTFADYSKEAEAPRRELFKKIVLAGMKCNLEIGTCASDKLLWKTVVNDLCRLNTSKEDVILTLQTIQKEFPDPKKRINATKAYLEKICTESENQL